jgi:hypothetical protein
MIHKGDVKFHWGVQKMKDDEEEEGDQSASNPPYSSDTFYSWLLQNSHHAETLFCPREPMFGSSICIP